MGEEIRKEEPAAVSRINKDPHLTGRRQPSRQPYINFSNTKGIRTQIRKEIHQKGLHAASSRHMRMTQLEFETPPMAGSLVKAACFPCSSILTTTSSFRSRAYNQYRVTPSVQDVAKRMNILPYRAVPYRGGTWMWLVAAIHNRILR